MSVDFDTSELAGLAADLAAAGPAAERLSSAKMTEVARQLRDDAKRDVAVLEGNVRDSIHVQGGQDYRKVIADDEAAFPLEFGTSDTAPQPYMWPNARVADQRLTEAIAEIDPLAGPRFR